MQSLFCTGSSLLCWLSLCCCYWHPWHFQVHFNSPIPISGDGGAAASPPVHPHRPLPNKTSQFCPSFTMGISQKNPVFTFLTHPSTQNPFSVEHREISVACVSHPLLYIFLRSATSVSDSSVWWLHTYFFDCSRWSTPFTSCDQMSWADARRGHQITKCRSFHCPIQWRQRFFFLSFTAALWALTLLSSNKTIKENNYVVITSTNQTDRLLTSRICMQEVRIACYKYFSIFLWWIDYCMFLSWKCP